MVESDNEPYKIVYGGIFIEDKTEKDKVFKLINDMKGYALANVEEGKVCISGYEDIIFLESGFMDNYVPFVALMQTSLTVNGMGRAVTYFPYTRKIIWEDIVNRDYLLAARKTVECSGNKDDWRKQIDIDVWYQAYIAALYVDDEGDEADKSYETHFCECCSSRREDIKKCMENFVHNNVK